MRKFLIALVAFAAISTLACSEGERQAARERYNNTWYEATKYVGDKPVERWYTHSASYNGHEITAYVIFKDTVIALGENVRIRRADEYGGPEKRVVLEAYIE